MKDATPFDLTNAASSCCFNPRVREGRDREQLTRIYYSCCFNPRVREGRDSKSVSSLALFRGFNPRVREGRDMPNGAGVFVLYFVSIHASVKDATVPQPFKC